MYANGFMELRIKEAVWRFESVYLRYSTNPASNMKYDTWLPNIGRREPGQLTSVLTVLEVS